MNKEEFYNIVEHLEKTDEMNYVGYYNGYPLLKSKDINNEIPEIYLCSGNRTAGKTFFFKRFIVRLSILLKKPCLLLTRKRTQLLPSAQSFIEDIGNCPDFGNLFTIESGDLTGIKEIRYKDNPVVLVSYLNYADDIKEASNYFNNVLLLMKDEFQLRSISDYCDDEIGKLRSIHKSCAREFGSKSRFLPTVLVGNEISIINPYYYALGITSRISSETKRVRGNGFVLNIIHNSSASEMALQSSFEKAFGEDEQFMSDNFNQYTDNKNYVQEIKSKYMRCIAVYYTKNGVVGVWSVETGFYVSKKVDPNCRRRFAGDLESHKDGLMLISLKDPFLLNLKEYFEKSCVLFQNIECRIIFLKLIGKACFL